MTKVGVVYDPIYLEHDTDTHVENAQRLVETYGLLKQSNLLESLTLISPRAATLEELSMVHSESHIANVQSLSSRGGGWLDMDTYACPRSYNVALYAAGGSLRGLDAVMNGEVRSAFCLVRPPGHHATRDHAMGFCLFNNVAIAARYALKNFGLKRVLIADFDVHHGNGTEEAFYSDPFVLYFSTHQYPHYPGTGEITDDGSGEGKGTTVNIPLPPGCGDTEYLRAYREVLVPAAVRFQPEFIFVSAGYDAHWADPLSGMQLSVQGFAEITATIKELARELCGGRVLVCLEGGYHLKALSYSIKATLEVLLGVSPGEDPLGKPQTGFRTPRVDSVLEMVIARHGLK